MAEVRALLCLSVLLNISDRLILCCIAIYFMLVLASKINNILVCKFVSSSLSDLVMSDVSADDD